MLQYITTDSSATMHEARALNAAVNILAEEKRIGSDGTGEGRLDHKARPDGSRGPETV